MSSIRFRRAAIAPITAGSLLLLAACTGGSAGPQTTPTATSPDAAESATPTLDANRTPQPVQTEAPPPSETKTFYGQALTLRAGGGHTLVVRYDGTSLDPVFVNAKRAFSVYLTLENREDEPFRGSIGRTVITDEFGNRFRPQGRPRPAQLDPDAPDYGYSNRNLTKPVTVPAGEQVRGALVFEVTGGPRVIQLKIALAKGEPPGVWETNFGLL